MNRMDAGTAENDANNVGAKLRALARTLWFRIPFALLMAPGVGLFVGFIGAMDVTKFEGAQGYAYVYFSLYAMAVAALVIPFLKSLAWQSLVLALSTLGWLGTLVIDSI